MPPILRVPGKRCAKADHLQRITQNGGTPAWEDAVVKGLRWLKANQAPDGSWGGHKAAMTGLALLAYSGHCETPASAEFGESCLKGIVYLVDPGLKNNGKLATNPGENSWPYEHAIATYALAEALKYLATCQNESGGFDTAWPQPAAWPVVFPVSSACMGD
jgi:hypothetical protein